MTVDEPLRIFLASPGDLAAERGLVDSVISRYNETRRRDEDRAYTRIGWESTRGTARRPQDEINELIGTSDFMIVLFKQSWGSDPGSPFGYTSGTEEELFVGLLALGLVEHPLKDIWIGFVDSPSPAPELVELKSQLRDRHTLLYESIDSDLDLDRKLSDRLAAWQQALPGKTARRLHLVPRSGRDVLGAAKRRLDGESLIRLGHADAGLVLLEEAASIGGPTEKLSYARALGRRGRIEEALVEVRATIEDVMRGSMEVNSTLAGEAFVTEAGLLRRQGSQQEAIHRLGVLLGELDSRASDAWRVKSRILDERGLASQHLGRIQDARADFLASLEIRQAQGRSLEVAQSHINLTRLETGQGNYGVADSYVDLVLPELERTPPTDLHANAWTAVAQLRLREGRAREGVPFALRALQLNEQTENKSGIAKSLLVITQCSREAGDIEGARAYAHRCLEVNESMGNAQGVALARWQLDQLPLT